LARDSKLASCVALSVAEVWRHFEGEVDNFEYILKARQNAIGVVNGGVEVVKLQPQSVGNLVKTLGFGDAWTGDRD